MWKHLRNLFRIPKKVINMKLGKKFLAGRLKSIWEQTNKTNVTQKEENAQQRNKAQEI